MGVSFPWSRAASELGPKVRPIVAIVLIGKVCHGLQRYSSRSVTFVDTRTNGEAFTLARVMGGRQP